MLRAIALAVVLVALAPGVARGASWRWPVDGRVVGPFRVSLDDPYTAGQRRGIAIAARPGASVQAACAGRVVFAGFVGRAGPTLSIGCGTLRATYQGLAAISVHTGTLVMPGQPIATVGRAGGLRLGARVEHSARDVPARYVDPATLMGRDRVVRPPLGRAPREPIGRRWPAAPPPASPLAVPAARRPSRSPAQAPPLAWLGLALIGIAAPIGALRVRRPAPTAAFRAWALRQLR